MSVSISDATQKLRFVVAYRKERLPTMDTLKHRPVPKNSKKRLWRFRQKCRFWQPIVMCATAALSLLAKIIVTLWEVFSKH